LFPHPFSISWNRREIAYVTEFSLAFLGISVNMVTVESKSSTCQSKLKQGNYIDTFVKQMFGRTLIFADFRLHYADPKVVSEVDLTQIRRCLFRV